jgi:hypothetical protein
MPCLLEMATINQMSHRTHLTNLSRFAAFLIPCNCFSRVERIERVSTYRRITVLRNKRGVVNDITRLRKIGCHALSNSVALFAYSFSNIWQSAFKNRDSVASLSWNLNSRIARKSSRSRDIHRDGILLSEKYSKCIEIRCLESDLCMTTSYRNEIVPLADKERRDDNLAIGKKLIFWITSQW